MTITDAAPAGPRETFATVANPVPVQLRLVESLGVPLVTLPPATESRWRDLAACGDADPELFFPLPNEFAAAQAAVDERCLQCPVRQYCRANAEDIGATQFAGVWGGIFYGGNRAWHPRPVRQAPPAPIEPRADGGRKCRRGGCPQSALPHRLYCGWECHHACIVGTANGDRAHREHGEKPCDPCHEALLQENRERHRVRRERRRAAELT